MAAKKRAYKKAEAGDKQAEKTFPIIVSKAGKAATGKAFDRANKTKDFPIIKVNKRSK
jgi:hypothetical protein